MNRPTALRVSTPALVALALLIPVATAGTVARAQSKAGAAERLEFPTATTTVNRKGSVRGYGSKDYELSAASGERLTIRLTSKSRFVYFNVLDKETMEAIDADPPPREVTEWTGAVPKGGVYIVRVYLVRAEARRGRTAAYALSIELGGATGKAGEASGAAVTAYRLASHSGGGKRDARKPRSTARATAES